MTGKLSANATIDETNRATGVFLRSFEDAIKRKLGDNAQFT